MRANTLRLRSPADVVAAIPYLVGFHPTDSVVVLCCGGADGTYAIRLDLTASDALLDHVTELITRRRPEDVILAGYGPGARVTPVVERVGDRLASEGVRLREVLRVEDARYWSYLCTDPACCPPEGTFVDVRGSAVAAAAIAGGLVALPDRDELARMIAPVGGERMRQAALQAERRLVSWAEGSSGEMGRRVADEGVRLVRVLIERARAGGDPPTDEEVAWLGVLLVNLRVRDEAWVRIDDGEIGAHIGLWRDVVRRVPESYLAGPACLLAFAAWRAGEGALANLALDRALAADPHYSMARLLHELFVSGLPPWSVPLDITPEQLDEAS
ncbi:DUF4192 domain-containing protein [Actinoallomurus purpureus]|uniref:DUF4192 domain-containing protein n=1 Tax=Actinoallomurus purpureus TaxID=478114 RepID=UPI0020925B19|nr:DUF4192 domain-containing protein [Actinoallomurus purpureus]MCO6008907.1 DUF4192 domain-containing protein [Actinoallomurus purpureus]